MEVEVCSAICDCLLFCNDRRFQLLQAQLAEFKQHAETIAFDFESNIKSSALKIESLENIAAASENALKEMTESTANKNSAVELERRQLQDQIKERASQVAMSEFQILGNSDINPSITCRKLFFWVSWN